MWKSSITHWKVLFLAYSSSGYQNKRPTWFYHYDNKDLIYQIKISIEWTVSSRLRSTYIINGHVALVAIVATIIQAPSHSCQVIAIHLKIGYPIFKWVAVTWTKWVGTSWVVPAITTRATCPIAQLWMKSFSKVISPCHQTCALWFSFLLRIFLF